MIAVRHIDVHAFGKEVQPARETVFHQAKRIRRMAFGARRAFPCSTHRARRIRQEGQVYVIDDRFSRSFLSWAQGGRPARSTPSSSANKDPVQECLIVTLEERSSHAPERMPRPGCGFSKTVFRDCLACSQRRRIFQCRAGGEISPPGAAGAESSGSTGQVSEKLGDLSITGDREFSPRSNAYFIRRDTGPMQLGTPISQAMRGLAPLIWAEASARRSGSGILAADAIITGKPYSPAASRAQIQPVELHISRAVMHRLLPAHPEKISPEIRPYTALSSKDLGRYPIRQRWDMGVVF